MNASCFEYRTYTATGDDSRTSRRRAKENLATVELAENFVRNSVTLELYGLEVLASLLGALADRFRYFVRLAVADANLTGLIACDNESGKAETASALNNLRATVDEDYLFGNAIIFALFALTAWSATIAARTTIATRAAIAAGTAIATWTTIATWATWTAVTTWTRTTWSACVLL